MAARAIRPLPALLLVGLAVLGAGGASAQQVVASDDVTSRVILRSGPTAKSADVGSLRPGDRAALLEAGDDWHRIRLAEGAEGFVSARWTVLVPTGWDVAARPPESSPEPPAAREDPAPALPEALVERHGERFDFQPEVTLSAARVDPPDRDRGGLGGLFQRIAGFFDPPADVTLELRSPNLEEPVRQHYDPRLPVAGRAHTSGSSGRFDVVLVIDVSASTSEFAEADVDGDGKARDAWKGEDSILKAQARAAAHFVEAVRRLPGNRDGRRIRVGVVTFSGEDGFALDPRDRDLDLDEADLFALSARDASLEIAPTRDYAAVLATLGRVGETPGRGMTDVAAGLTRAVAALTGLADPEAPSEAPEAAERVVYFLTDGKPRLPYDREKAERAALKAARLARRHHVRIHTFALGRNAVTGKLNSAVKRVARETGGVCVEISNPADVVPLLRATALSFVDGVKLVNRTTGKESDYVTTGIDGSFYGEIPLVEGTNEIELVAVLYGGREHVERLRVDFEPVPREQRLAEELEEIRRENEGLIEEIKEKLRGQLARRMEAERERARDPDQDKELEITLEREADEAR